MEGEFAGVGDGVLALELEELDGPPRDLERHLLRPFHILDHHLRAGFDAEPRQDVDAVRYGQHPGLDRRAGGDFDPPRFAEHAFVVVQRDFDRSGRGSLGDHGV